jgi:hypothetical protein
MGAFKEKVAMKSSKITTQKTKLAMAALTVLCFAASAVAQFEVSPDHFDGPSTGVTTPARPQQQDLQARMAEQKRILDSYHTQIKVKSQEVETIWQDLIANGTEGGQDLALRIREKELERLRNLLAAQISTVEETLAYLQHQEATLTAQAQSKPVPAPTRVHSAGMKSKRHRGTTLRASVQAAR